MQLFLNGNKFNKNTNLGLILQNQRPNIVPATSKPFLYSR